MASISGMGAKPKRGPMCVPNGIELRRCASVAELQEPHELPPGRIHLWHASPTLLAFDKADAAALLSPDEQARLERFRFVNDKNNFLFCRGMLRMLLASYLGDSPAELVFAYSAHGKPSLAGPSMDLKFNMSHSNGDVLIAACLRWEIGVDIEQVRYDLNVREIAQRFFSTAENETIRTMPVTSCYDTFFACWTRKEAFVKARGEGLSCPLNSFDVSVNSHEERVTLTTRPDASEAGHWNVCSLNGLPGFAAAVAVEIMAHGSVGGRQ